MLNVFTCQHCYVLFKHLHLKPELLLQSKVWVASAQTQWPGCCEMVLAKGTGCDVVAWGLPTAASGALGIHLCSFLI